MLSTSASKDGNRRSFRYPPELSGIWLMHSSSFSRRNSAFAKFMAGVETSMASQRRGRHEVAPQFGNARAHLLSVVLAQRSNQSTS
ncbi:hypothetical protein [Mesorhizobium sp. WSM3864]|uniref:hypothetical protein n=1 Tax=Mesorhizobium sp. WSM3864 TaxID=2029404 RepID=UPI001481DBBC|nr:hypothetical protein [Mesorhizobium sp. WSM3864]